MTWSRSFIDRDLTPRAVNSSWDADRPPHRDRSAASGRVDAPDANHRAAAEFVVERCPGPTSGQHTFFRLPAHSAPMSDGATWFGLRERVKPLVEAGVVLGVGLGGFFDGVVFHQVLQWHHVLSANVAPTTVADLRVNVLADGLFHVTTYAFTVVGIVLLFYAWRTPDVPARGRTLLGSVVMGWGLFNVVEGAVNHQLLGIHHVWPAGPGPVVLWDVAFLVWGALFVVGGYVVVRGDDPRPPER
jgi:uncharacterized membrane protein